MNEEELEEFMEVLEEKGAVVDKFKQEFLGIIDKSENLNLTVFGHEKEMNNLMAEMNSLREQSSATKRVIDESVSSQEAISLQVTSFQQRIRAASIRENSNKNEIFRYQIIMSYFFCLKKEKHGVDFN